MELIVFGASAGLAQILTNLDNLALAFALLPGLGPAGAARSLFLAQVITLGAGFAISLGASLMGGGVSGLVGVLPITLGLWALWRRHQGKGGQGTPRTGLSSGVAVLMFLGLSGDSLAIMAPLLLDSSPPFRAAAMTGALTAAVLSGAALLALGRVASRAERIARRGEWLAPYVMIAAGLYVVWNSGTDLA